jgi:hypothetical protein
MTRFLRASAESSRETRRIEETPEGFLYCDAEGVEHTLRWSEVQRVAWYEPPYGPLGSTPQWHIGVNGGGLDIDDWWEGSHRLAQLLAEKLSGFKLPPPAHEYAEEPAEGFTCWTRSNQRGGDV